MAAPHPTEPPAMQPTAEGAPGLHEPVLPAGTLVGGRYVIEQCLGTGGMASVFRARHVGLDQPVAIKVVSPLIREAPGIVARFMREARAATRLKGSHIVRVFDVGTTDDGAPFMVMELLEGQDLAQILAGGFRPTIEQAIDYVLQACEALAEVHGLGIVHRDLKPANVFLTRGSDGGPCVKLIDFGISRVDSPLWGKEAVSLTNPEVAMGSPRYMPPEQMESASNVDARSDIWGLGAILYEMLVGTSPFDGSSMIDIYAAAVRSPPAAPSTRRDDVPKELDHVVLKCLRVEQAERYEDVAALAYALAVVDGTSRARAESIARVLEASRARAQGTEPAAIEHVARPVGQESSIRRRGTTEPRKTRRRRLATSIAVTLALVGVGVAAAPIARRMYVPETTAVEEAVSQPTLTTAATPEREPQPEPEPAPAVADVVDDAAPSVETTPAPSTTAPVARPAPARTFAPRAPMPRPRPAPTFHSTANERPPAPPVTSATGGPREDRTLFEERK